MSLQTWGQIRLNSKSKVPRWDDLPVSWLQTEPLLVSYEAGGLLQRGGSQGIPPWGQWNGGSRGGGLRWAQWPCGFAFPYEVHSRPRTLLTFLSVGCV